MEDSWSPAVIHHRGEEVALRFTEVCAGKQRPSEEGSTGLSAMDNRLVFAEVQGALRSLSQG